MNIWFCFRDPFPFYRFPFFFLVSCCPWGKDRNDSVMDARGGEVAMNDRGVDAAISQI